MVACTGWAGWGVRSIENRQRAQKGVRKYASGPWPAITLDSESVFKGAEASMSEAPENPGEPDRTKLRTRMLLKLPYNFSSPWGRGYTHNYTCIVNEFIGMSTTSAEADSLPT